MFLKAACSSAQHFLLSRTLHNTADRAASIWNIANQHGREKKKAGQSMHWFLKLPHENSASYFCLYFIGQSESHDHIEVEKDILLQKSKV